jgi:hypothetical protein
MSQPPRKKLLPAKSASKKPPSAKDKKEDSEDIERAVYDGMQDLRAEKPRK